MNPKLHSIRLSAFLIVLFLVSAAWPGGASEHDTPDTEPFGPETGTFYIHQAKDFPCRLEVTDLSGPNPPATDYYATNVVDDPCATTTQGTGGSQSFFGTTARISVRLLPYLDAGLDLVEGEPIQATLWFWTTNVGAVSPKATLEVGTWSAEADAGSRIGLDDLALTPNGMAWHRVDLDFGPAPEHIDVGLLTLTIDIDNGPTDLRRVSGWQMGLGYAGDHKSTFTLPLDEQTSLPPDDPVDPEVWPPALQHALIRPGVQHVTGNGQCTTNFVFRDLDTEKLYIGTAAHCVGHVGQTSNIRTTTGGTGIQATVAFMSYDVFALRQSDFALMEVKKEDEHLVHPAVLRFGGPTHLANTNAVQTLDKVITYGNSGLRPGPAILDAHEGYVTGRSTWYTSVYTVTPGIFGDSGSGIMTATGGAIGAASTIALAPIPGENHFANIPPVLDWLNGNGWNLELQTWDLIDPGLLPAPYG